MKILYLFNRVKEHEMKRVEEGMEHDNHFFGMLRLKEHGVEAEYKELEQHVPRSMATFLRRRLLNIHFAHIPLAALFLKYDIIFTSTAFGTLLLKVLLGIKKPRWVVFDYNIRGMIGERKTFREKMIYFLMARVDGIITLSKGEEVAVRGLFPSKEDAIQFIPLGTDVEFFKPNTGLAEENFILSVGRDPGRDFKTLFEAVRDMPVEVKLTVRPEKLKNLEPFPGNVTFHEFTPRELVEQYAKAKIVVIPLAIKNGAPNDAMGCSTLVEALAMGKAVIATRTDTMESYITHEQNGLLVEPGDPASLKMVINQLLCDTNKREKLGREARKFVVENCSADTFAVALAKYFKTIS